MSSATLTEAVPGESGRWPVKWLSFTFLLGLFYLATPLDVAFSASELANIERSDLTANDRANTNAEATSEGSLSRRVGLLLLGVFGASCLVRSSYRRLGVNGLLGFTMLFFLAWCALSVTWSIDPQMTARKLAALGLLLLGAIGIAKQFSLRDLVHFTAFSAALLLVVGFACELGLGTFRPWDSLYRFSGLTWPAFLCWMLSLLVLACLTLLSTASQHRALLIALLCTAVVGVIMTKTRAGLGALAAGFAIHAALTWPLRRTILSGGAIVVLAAVALMAAELVWGNVGDKLIDVVNLGRAESAEGLSGRQQLWLDLLEFVRDRPVTGFGYESFWTPAHLLEIGEKHWGAPDAHNGYLNLTLGVGLVGMLACLAAWLMAIASAVRGYRATGDQSYVFACCALVVLLVNSLFVSTQLAPALYAFISLVILARLGFITEREPTAERPA